MVACCVQPPRADANDAKKLDPKSDAALRPADLSKERRREREARVSSVQLLLQASTEEEDSRIVAPPHPSGPASPGAVATPRMGMRRGCVLTSRRLGVRNTRERPSARTH